MWERLISFSGEIKTELISELKFVIKSAVTQAIEDAIEPLQDCINKQNDKITCLKAENEQMKGKLNKRIEQIEDRYDKSGFNIVVSTSLHILKDWPCVLKVTCLSLPGFGTSFGSLTERCRLEGGFICSKGFVRKCVFFLRVQH
jgi:hypothetical protein